MPLGVPGRIEHLWFALTDPDDNGKFLGANLTGYELYKDTTVVLESGHPFITKKSVIQFSDSKLFEVSNIEFLLSKGYAQKKQPCSSKLLGVIRKGLMDSDDAPQDMQDYLKRRLA